MRGQFIYIAIFALGALVWQLPVPNGLRYLMAAAMAIFILRLKRNVLQNAVVCFIVFSAIGYLQTERHHSSFSGEETEWEVTFSEEIAVDGDLLKATVSAANGEKLRLLYRLASLDEAKVLQSVLLPGLTCQLAGELTEPKSARNRNGFDYKDFLSANQIYWLLEVKQLRLSSCHQNTSSLITKIQVWRIAALAHIHETFPANLEAAAAALLFGDRSLLDEELTAVYQRLGIIHLLAISGLHVGLITAFVYYCLIRFGVTKENAQHILLLSLPVYTVFAGASPPVIRAVLMSVFVLLAAKYGKKISPLDALSVSFLLVSAINPYLIFQAGFQLSYTVSFSLLLSSSILQYYTGFLSKMFAVTVISQLASLPIIMYHFFEISVISLAANLFFVPFYSFAVLPFMLVVFCLSYFIPLVGQLLLPLGWLLETVNGAAFQASQWPFAVFVTGRPSIPLLTVLIICCIIGFWHWENKKNIRSILAGSAACLLSLQLWNTHSFKGEVSFIDVGQGEAIFIQLPYGKGTYLIDTGGLLPFQKEGWQQTKRTFTIGKDVLLPYFKSRGITEIDKLILTHSDYDHIGAASELVEGLKIKQMIISPGSESKAVMKETILAAATKKIPVVYGKKGEYWQAGDARFQFLAPDDEQYEGNNDSLVLYANIGGKKWLFTGDMEAEGEIELASRFKLETDVLKVGHHGSKSSTTDDLIEMTEPQTAIISAGRKNRYGHPHPEVISRLTRNRIQIYRTDENGEITYTFRNEQGTFSTVFP
ncbi:competence protein ComEC [Bacillus ectoiniformans]|uniref:DNA internalization-related competence protein ComEC/Rec2 n=1 Tax=Bacillus ectoiniformans TaxID=1494429 RepID=UPI00195E693E|nr:DNA internalization-related competence protein ComEC/Rec2 [Bacillus ectoiniformans]MBM7649973.1 competence protein ComEC [Bacillus ectoiniformans]